MLIRGSQPRPPTEPGLGLLPRATRAADPDRAPVPRRPGRGVKTVRARAAPSPQQRVSRPPARSIGTGPQAIAPTARPTPSARASTGKTAVISAPSRWRIRRTLGKTDTMRLKRLSWPVLRQAQRREAPGLFRRREVLQVRPRSRSGRLIKPGLPAGDGGTDEQIVAGGHQ